MTQILKITEKEMTRRTGTNALGYSLPDKDTILLRKDLTGKLKRKVLDHEIDHLSKGEEGPFLGGISAGLGAISSIAGARAQDKAAKRGLAFQKRGARSARRDLEPYREYGEEAMSALRDMEYRDPTMEEVTGGQGYKTRLGAIEGSAAARGGLLSGNALRDIGEFGAAEFERERGRRRENYMDEFNRRMAQLNIGYGAAGGQAGITQRAIPGMVSSAGQRGASRVGMYQGIAQPIAGALGEYQGQQQWQDYLDRAYPQGDSEYAGDVPWA